MYRISHNFQIYDENSLLDGKLELLENTKMVDYSTDVYKARNPDQPEPPQSMPHHLSFAWTKITNTVITCNNFSKVELALMNKLLCLTRNAWEERWGAS